MTKRNELALYDVSLANSGFKIYEVGDLGSLTKERDKTAAILLSCIPSFLQEKDDIKNQYTSDPIWPTPTPPIKAEKKIILDKTSSPLLFPDFDHDELYAAIAVLLKRYKLSERWHDAVLVLCVYGFMVLPLKSSISSTLTDDFLYQFDKMRQQIKKSTRRTSTEPGLLQSLATGNKTSTDPAQGLGSVPPPTPRKLIITVSEQVTAAELARLITTSPIIKKQLSKLEKTPYTRMPSDAKGLYWGHHVWAYKEYIDPTSSMGMIEQWLDKHLPDEEDVPGSRELATFYDRFQKARNNFLP